MPSTWTWDDGEAPSASSTGPRPAVWGNHQPISSGRARAFINLEAGYDNGLAYAYTIPEDSIQSTQAMPYVCQY